MTAHAIASAALAKAAPVCKQWLVSDGDRLLLVTVWADDIEVAPREGHCWGAPLPVEVAS